MSAALVLESAWLVRERQRHRWEQRRASDAVAMAAEHVELHRIATLVAGGASTDEVCARVAEAAGALFEAELAFVIRLSKRGCGELRGRFLAKPLPGCPEVGERLAFDSLSALGQLWETGRSARLATGESSLFTVNLGDRIATPIVSPAGVWGALAVGASPGRSLGADVDERLQRFSELVALAIANTEASEQLTVEAMTDALTGLANRRVFHERLAEEVARSERHERPLALALIDLDGFKEINDRFGHQSGDAALIDTAQRLREGLRGSDLLARVGGDEFALVMPETQLGVARSLAERVHGQVEQAARERQDRPTVSIGLSHLDEVTTVDELLRAADRSLYGAKAEGRNRVRGQTPDFDLLSLSRDRQLVKTQSVSAVRALARAVDIKDSATREHSDRVAELAGHLAEILGWPPQRIERLRHAALVHDVGKISIPDAVLLKPGRLTRPEYELVKTHAAIGADIVAEALDDEQVGWVRGHHERYDGSGYPDGLAAEAIPDGARILAVADAWDAMTSDRPYQPERSPEAALQECRRCAESHFFREVVAAFDDHRFARLARILANERAARDINQDRVGDNGVRDTPSLVVDLRCECFDAACRGTIPVELREIQEVRAHPRRFVVLPGHVMPDAEATILRTERFLVVEKRM